MTYIVSGGALNSTHSLTFSWNSCLKTVELVSESRDFSLNVSISFSSNNVYWNLFIVFVMSQLCKPFPVEANCGSISSPMRLINTAT